MLPLYVTTAFLALATTAGAISKVTRTGRYLYTDDGTRFIIKGVAYQPAGLVVASSDNSFEEPSTFTDPLADATGCTRDLPFLQMLGVNTIRAYSVDSSLNHDSCMNAFSAAGIYTIIDLALPLNGSIDRNTPAWSTNIQDQYLATIAAFSKYDNVLAYNVGNEVMLVNSTAPAPFVKAAARDIKAYLTSISSSALVGYAAIDGPADFLEPLANYLSCDPSGSNSGSSAIDLFGLNNYEWCGDAPSTTYDGVNSEFAGYNVAAYFSEFGSETCNPDVRVWTETGTLFASPMTDIWSGGLAFSYFPASSSAGQFGMVNISADGTTVTPNQDFNNLVTQYGMVSANFGPSQSSATASSFPACPTVNSTWAASNTLPSTPNDAACACLENAMSCQFQISSSNYSALVGTLTDTACGLLGSSGGTCDDIGSNGTTGVYGRVSMCNPVTKLSYVFSQYFELNGREASACSFDGNGTVNAGAPSETAGAAVTSCGISTAVFTPSFSATATAKSGSSSGSTDSGSSSGSVSAVLGGNVLAAGCMTVLSALWILCSS